MKISNFSELKNGGAAFDIFLSEDELELMLNYAVNRILSDYVENMEKAEAEVSHGPFTGSQEE